LVRIRFIHVFEDRRALRLIERRGVGAGETGIEFVLDRQPKLGSRRRLLAPVQNQKVLQTGQENLGNAFDLRPLFGSQFGRWTGQDVEEDEFLLREVLPDVSFLLFGVPSVSVRQPQKS
jgi:hypothetical protein